MQPINVLELPKNEVDGQSLSRTTALSRCQPQQAQLRKSLQTLYCLHVCDIRSIVMCVYEKTRVQVRVRVYECMSQYVRVCACVFLIKVVYSRLPIMIICVQISQLTTPQESFTEWVTSL